MRKLLFELLVKLFTCSESKTKRIMQIAYDELPFEEVKSNFSKCSQGHYYNVKLGSCGRCFSNSKPKVVEEAYFPVCKTKSKKDELLENLNYLKNKSNKTKQDKESIYTLEMVLKNMK